MKKSLRFISVLLILTMIVSSLTACSKDKKETKDDVAVSAGQNGESAASDTKEPIQYSVLTVFDETASADYDNPNDVVSPAIKEKFGISVSDVTFNGGMTPIERINMLVASDTVPDVVIVDNPNIAAFYETGAFADLSEYKDLMKNTDKYISDIGWNRLSVDGKLVAIPGDMSGGEIDLENPQLADVVNDPYYSRPGNWALLVNESILKQAGYTVKTVSELQSELDANSRKITDEDIQITPSIKTVADLETLLTKVKELNLKVDGKPVIPLSLPDWGGFHMSVLSAPTGGWYCNPDTMEVSGFLFNPGMKEFYKTWKNWFDKDLIDKDYIIHKGEQYQEKVASGRVAVVFPGGIDLATVRASLKEQGSDLKVIPWPETSANSYVDASFPCGFKNIMINKNCKDIPRLLEYFDWFQTEEAKDLMSWGPESAGLWEIKDGVKVFKDTEFANDVISNAKTADGRGAEYYGLVGKDYAPHAKATLCAPAILFNEKSVDRSYPLKMDAYTSSYAYVSTEMLNRDGTVLPSAGEKSNTASGYYWSVIKTTKIASLLSTKSDEEFNKVWQEILDDFKANGDYDAATEEMRAVFKISLGK
ncbi:extracellular solute-binding protein [Lachnoclostridium sp.]|uniref:extracellular solute-binding protein n=1 Tax=Lachnoclostridium sp. TaxID=2028282 RepID=UPI0028A0DFC5|nr:extracellular solute-binding protein [Lachnoclostridium sp.]